MYISSLPTSVHDVIIYSDCCAGQNRNQYLATSFMHAVNTIPHVQSITHKYLVTGHTQMECDSMHSAIATAKKNTAIYTPSGWDIVLRMARRNNPYLVIPLKHKDILDFKQVASTRVQNTKKDSKGQRVSGGWISSVLNSSKKRKALCFSNTTLMKKNSKSCVCLADQP